MGRSVNYITNALGIAYINYQCDEDDVHGEDWDFFKEGLIENLKELCPSLCELRAKVWDDREVLVIAENSHCQIGLSEYCGLVSVSIRVHDDYRTKESLAENWINQVWPKISAMIAKNYQALSKLGSFSNGEGVFQEIKKS